MDETNVPPESPQPPTAPQPGAPAATARLTRSRSDRVLAGVAGGLGRHMNTDPVIFRIGIVVAVLMTGGMAILGYVAAWAIIPEEHRDRSISDSYVGSNDTARNILLILLALVCLPFLLFFLFVGGAAIGGFSDIHTIEDMLLVLVVVGLIVMFGRSRWSVNIDRTSAPPPAPPADHLDGGAGVPAPPAPAPAPPPPPPPPPQPRGPSVTRYVLSALLVAAGVAVLLDRSDVMSVDAGPFLAFCLVVIGLGIALGHRYGRTGGLKPIGAVLVLLLAAGSADTLVLNGGIGDVEHQVTSFDELEDRYRLSAGKLVVDLSQLPTDQVRAIDVDVRIGMGEVTVVVPDDSAVDARGSAGLGDVSVFGHVSEGVAPESNVSSSSNFGPEDGQSHLSIHLRVHAGFGEVNIERADSPIDSFDPRSPSDDAPEVLR